MTEILTYRDKRLALDFIAPTQAGRGIALSLHGGGLSTRASTNYLADCFTDRGIGWASFDCSGWGDSAGERSECSLADRCDDALIILRHLGLPIDFLIGTSMGGYGALKLLEQTSARNLILFCPAAYAREAWSLRFGHGFTDAIRRPASYLDSDADALCAAYTGNVLYVAAEHDAVIPKDVDAMYRRSFRQARRVDSVLLRDCPHPIHRWAIEKPERVEHIRSVLCAFIDAELANPD